MPRKITIHWKDPKDIPQSLIYTGMASSSTGLFLNPTCAQCKQSFKRYISTSQNHGAIRIACKCYVTSLYILPTDNKETKEVFRARRKRRKNIKR